MENRIVLSDDLISNPVVRAVLALREVILSGMSEFDSLRKVDFSERDLLLINFGRNYGALEALDLVLEQFEVKDHV